MTCLLTLADISGDTWSEVITSAPKVLGRTSDVDICLDHPSVSRQHCRFWAEEGTCYVEDCGSTNGTYVNGLRVEREKIAPGDTIVVGRFELVVEEKRLCDMTADYPRQAGNRAIIDRRNEERHLARIIHQRMTPSRRMSLPGIIIDVHYRPSGLLGGDSFEVVELGNRWILSLFDPMTHGVKAAMSSMLLRAELQRWIALTAEPARCLKWINSELLLLDVNELYISAVIATWFPRTQTLVYGSAGEHPPMILHSGRLRNECEIAGGMPLGVQLGENYSEHLVQLKPGDRVFLFTDGVGEALRKGDASGVAAHGLARRIESTASLPLAEQMQQLLAGIPHEILDDILLVACEITEG